MERRDSLPAMGLMAKGSHGIGLHSGGDVMVMGLTAADREGGNM